MDTNLLDDQLWAAPSEADAARMARILVWARKRNDTDPDLMPWTITLDSGYQAVAWLPIKTAIALSEKGVDCLGSSERDLVQDWWRSQAASGRQWDPHGFGCDKCTRHDICGNHEQHGNGCHCLYRGDFCRAYAPDGTRLTLCVRHRHLAPEHAVVIKVEFA